MTRGGFANALFKQTLSRSKSSFLRNKHLAPFTKTYIPHNNIRIISKGYRYQQKNICKINQYLLVRSKPKHLLFFPAKKRKGQQTHRFTASPYQPYQPSINASSMPFLKTRPRASILRHHNGGGKGWTHWRSVDGSEIWRKKPPVYIWNPMKLWGIFSISTGFLYDSMMYFWMSSFFIHNFNTVMKKSFEIYLGNCTW